VSGGRRWRLQPRMSYSSVHSVAFGPGCGPCPGLVRGRGAGVSGFSRDTSSAVELAPWPAGVPGWGAVSGITFDTIASRRTGWLACGLVQCGAVQRSAVQHSAVQCSAVSGIIRDTSSAGPGLAVGSWGPGGLGAVSGITHDTGDSSVPSSQCT
jgi:hypothetical protein